MVAPPTALRGGGGRMHHVKSTPDKNLSDFEATLAMLPPRFAARLSLDPSGDSSPQVNCAASPCSALLLDCTACSDAVQHAEAHRSWRRKAAGPAHPRSMVQKPATAAAEAAGSPAAAPHSLAATEAKTGAAPLSALDTSLETTQPVCQCQSTARQRWPR